jgi:hypothetical protein
MAPQDLSLSMRHHGRFCNKTQIEYFFESFRKLFSFHVGQINFRDLIGSSASCAGISRQELEVPEY